MQIRVCTSLPVKDIDASGLGKYIPGWAGEVSDVRLGLPILARHNISLVYYSLKHSNHQQHKNCYTPLQGNDADITTQNLPLDSVSYPSSNLTQAPPVGQYDPAFVSLFTSASAADSPDLFDFVMDFPADVIVVMGALLFLLMTISCIKYVNDPRIRNSTSHKSLTFKYLLKLTWKITASTLGNWQAISSLVRMKLIVIMLISLIVTLRIMCILSMRTEQVVSMPTRRLDSIDQLIRNKVPFSYLTWHDYAVFKKSKNKKIADIIAFSEDMHVYKKLDQTQKLIPALKSQEQVYITQSYGNQVRTICEIAIMHGIDVTGYGIDKVQLDHVPHPLVGNIISSRFVKGNPLTAKLIRRSIRISVEADVMRPYERKVNAILTKSAGVSDITRRCNLTTGKSSTIMLNPSFKSMDRLTSICSILVTCALLLFLAENSIRLRASRKIFPARKGQNI